MEQTQMGSCPHPQPRREASRASLDSSGNNFPSPSQRRKGKKTRTRSLRKVFRTMGTTKSERLCGVGLSEAGSPSIVCSRSEPLSQRSNVFFCKSRACPGCVAHENAKLVNRIVPALKAALVNGHWVLFVTLTLKHNRRTSPEKLLDGLSKCWTAVNKRLKKSYPGFEAFRSRDYTWSERNGHHFHLHGLLILPADRLGKPAQLVSLQDAVWRAWSGRSEKLGYGKCSRDAFFLEVCQTDTSEEQIARYTAKLTKSAFETVAHNFKTGGEGSLTAFQLMEQAHLATEGSKEKKTLLAAWYAYKGSIYNRRSWGATRGFFKLAELREDDPQEETEPMVPSDVDVLTSLDLQDKWEVYILGRRFWCALVQLDITEEVQDVLELGTCGQLRDRDKLGFQELVQACQLSITERHTIEIEEWSSWAKSWSSQYLFARVA